MISHRPIHQRGSLLAPLRRIAMVAVCLSAAVAVPLMAGGPTTPQPQQDIITATAVAALPARRAKPATAPKPPAEIESARSALAWLRE